MNRDVIKNLTSCHRVVIKIGTSLLLQKAEKEGKNFGASLYGIDETMLKRLCSETLFLRKNGVQVMIITSGAVHVGRQALRQYDYPSETELFSNEKEVTLQRRQALSAFGQNILLSTYERVFASVGIPVAQLLLTASEFLNRRTYINMAHTINEVLKLGGLPIINENDTIAIDELQFGENDLLSASCAALFHADYLFILTSVEGLLDSQSKRFSLIDKILPEHWSQAKGPEGLGRGGMQTKLRAAKLCNISGIHCAILPGGHSQPIRAFFEKTDIGTLFVANRCKRLNARKKWLLFSRCRGSITIDAGARKALEESGSSLLPVGVCSLQGQFLSHEVVEVQDKEGKLIGRGIVNYSYKELVSMMDLSSLKVQKQNITWREKELIHRNNLVLESQIVV